MSTDTTKDTTNTFLTIEEMNAPHHRAILEPAYLKAGFHSYDAFTAWLASPAIAPFWTEFDRGLLQPLVQNKESVPNASDLPCPIYTLIPLFEALFGTKHNLCKNPTKEKWKPNHHIIWFFLKVWEHNHDEMQSSPWAGCYADKPRTWAMQLCWVLDGMTRCKYGEEVGVKEVKFPNGQTDRGCVIVYKM